MTGLREEAPPRAGAPSAWVVTAVAVAGAVVVNLALYGAGGLAGADYEFTQSGEPVHVDPVTVAGFSAVPLSLGLLVVALLSRWLPWVVPVASVLAPVLAVATIGIMTIPVDLDTTSTISLALCHLTLAPISVVAIRRIAHARRAPG